MKAVINNSNSLLPATSALNHWWNCSSIPACDHNSVLNFVEIEYLFPLQEAMCSYNETQDSLYDPTKLAVQSILRPEEDLLSSCGQIFKKTVSFNGIVHFIDEENIVTYVYSHCGITFYPETPTKISRVNPERNFLSRSCGKAKWIPSNDQHNCFLMNSRVLISFWTHITYGTWFQQLLCHPNTLTIDTLCPISTLNHQLTKLEQTHIRCSLDCERWKAKWKDCASALHSCRDITNRTDDWTKQLLRLKIWVIPRNPEQWLEFRRLWWTVIVLKCSYLFHLFDLYCLLVTYLLFLFWKITFLFPFFGEFEWEVKIHRLALGKVTLLQAAEPATDLCTLQKFTLAYYLGAHSPQPPLSITYFNTWSGGFSAWS